MSLIIAACAITLTLLVVAQEKASEIALYRTLGAYRRQVFLLFVSKGTAMAFLGLAMGYAAGIALGVILIFRHSKELLRLEHRVDLALAVPGRRSPRHRLRRRAGEPLPGVQGQPHAGE